MSGILHKIGGAFSWLGKKSLWFIRRNETLFALSLAADVIPIPALDKIILLVKSLDRKNKSGKEKMAEALVKIIPILREYGIEAKKESDLRLLVELCVAMLNKKARVISE